VTRPRALAFAAVCVVSAAVWWWGWRRDPVIRDPARSVILISIDTLRADALGAYGARGVATPWIDRLAREGLRFETAHAHNVVTLPSHSNMLSGLPPTRHGVRDNTGFRFPADIPTLASRLKALGRVTGAFVSAFVLDSRFGLDQGFDLYDDRTASLERQSPFTVPDRPGPETVGAALRWIESQGDRPYFAFIHLYDPHFPYRPPEPYASRHRERPYDGEVEATDAALGPLLSRILDGPGKGRTLVILTADHGESLGEHGESTHGIFAYEGTLRVPLIVWGATARGSVVRDPAQHIDIVPTVLDALAAPVPTDLPGRSLLKPIPARATYFEALSTSLNQGWAPLRGTIEGGFKYIDLPIPEVYDLAGDPRETRNLAALEPERLERLRGQLGRERALDRGTKRVEEDAATLERLRALGYVAASQPAEQKETYTAADDPKNLIEIDTRNRAVVTAYMEGRIGEAIAMARENLRLRPDMSGASLQLAYLERAQGNLGAAIAAARRAVQLRPLHAEGLALLGAYLTEAGQAQEAVRTLEPFVRGAAPDVDVLTAFGLAHATLGRVAEAREAFESVSRIDPGNAMALVNLGTLDLMTGKRAEARARLMRAVAIDPHVAKAHNTLGVLAAQEGRLEEAIAYWRTAAENNPRDYQSLFNLGTTLDRLGRTGEADSYFRRYLAVAPRALERRDIERIRRRLGVETPDPRS
jgi:arylsulfatase A-like enzyme/Flp pilus assembly protein TadD